jgi:hypothetical protein
LLIVAGRHQLHAIFRHRSSPFPIPRHGEIAEQLADFRGELRSNGKPDDLMKHLGRVDVISKHVQELMKFTGLENAPQIEGNLVFKHPVPMQFVWERMRKRGRLHVFAGLDAI